MRRSIGLLDRVDRDDVRVVEGGNATGLTAESFEPIGIGGHSGRQHLEGDIASESRVVRAIDLAHPAGANGRNDRVVAQCPADQRPHPFLQGRHLTAVAGVRPFSRCRQRANQPIE